MGTNQIKSFRRTKKSGPTINEHRKEKTYLKRVSVNVSGVWLSKCVATGDGFDAKGWDCLRVRVFQSESVSMWEWVIWVGFDVWQRRVFKGESVWVTDLGVRVSDFESFRVSDFESDKWVWKFESDFERTERVWKFESDERGDDIIGQKSSICNSSL